MLLHVGEKQACQTERFSATAIDFNRLGMSLAPLLVFCIDFALQQPIRRQTAYTAISQEYFYLVPILVHTCTSTIMK